MYKNMTIKLPRVNSGLLLMLGLACGQLLFAQKNSNQPPVAVDDAATVLQGNSVVIPVLNNDYDPDGDPLSVQNVRRARGVIHVQDDGTLLYQATPNFVGEDAFEYTIIDGNKGKASANVVVLVTAPQANHDPLAIDDNALTDEDIPVTIDALANDSDEDGDALAIASVTQGASGSVAIENDGTITYAPAPDFNGTDSFTYTISDGAGGSASATVSVSVSPVNDAPVADDQSVSTGEDESVTIILAGSDVDGDPLSYSIITGPANGQLSGTPPNLTYTPNTNFNGQDGFTFEIRDGQASDQGIVTISIGAFNDPPVAVSDEATTDEDTPVTIAVLTNDTDPEGDVLSVESITQGTAGSVTLNPDGTTTYSPNADYNGSDSFSYTISDGNGGTNEGNVSITVNAVNDAPVAVDDAAGTPEDTPITIDILANDSDVDGDPLTVQNVTQAKGVVHINPDGTLAYEPTPNFFGLDEFYYTVLDGNGGQATATVTVNVGSENDAPVAIDDAAATDEDTPVTIDVLTNDSDPDGDALTITNVASGSNGSTDINPDGTVTYTPNANFNGSDNFNYTVSDGQGGTATAAVSITVSPINDPPVITSTSTASATEDEEFIYTATADDIDGGLITFTFSNLASWLSLDGASIYGTPPEGATDFTFTIIADDGQEENNLATLQVAVTVGGVNDPPVAVDLQLVTDEDQSTSSFTLTASDPENDLLTFEILAVPAHGVLEGTAPDLIYTPEPHYFGEDNFTFQVSDGTASDDGAVSITVNAVNDAPVANDDEATTQEETPITIHVLANDYDVDGDVLTVHNVTQANAVVHPNPDGTLAYEPNPNFYGVDEFTYTIEDPDGAKATATVIVTVSSENDAPIAVDDAATTDEDTPVTIDVLENDSDPEGDDISIAGFSQGTNGSVAQNPDGTLDYTPTENYFGSDFFTYTVSDGELNSETATVSITVEAINDPPVITSPSQASATEGALFTYLASATDSDDDDGSIIFSFTNLPVWLAADGTTLTGTPGEGDGSTSFTITADDGHAENNYATLEVTLTVDAVNDPPVAYNQEVATDEDVAAAITLSGFDPESVPLAYEVLTTPEHGTLTGDAPDLTYEPNTDYYGEDSFTFRVNDGDLNSEAAQVSITVNPVNDAPVITSPASAEAAEDQLFTYIATVEDVDDESVEITFDGLPKWVTIDGPTVSGTPGEGATSFEFSIIADDGHDANNLTTLQVQVDVGAVNDPPEARDLALETNEDQGISFELTASDIENDPLTFELLTAPSHGTLEGTVPDLSYIPEPDYFGEDDFTFRVSDGTDSDDGEVTITILAVNDNPVAMDDEANTPQNTSVTIAALTNDVDIDSDDLTVTGASGAGHGAVEINPDGTLTYTPEAGFSGTDSFQYTISDGDGGSATATVTVYVNISETAVTDSVGSGGGTIDTEFGAGIEIPAGALNSPVNIVISQFATAPPGVTTAGPVFFFGPTGTYFNVPVTITVSYDPDRIPAGLDASRLTLLCYNEDDGSWEIIPGTVDSLAHLVTGQTDHFSGFSAGFAPNHAPIVAGLPDGITIIEDTDVDTLVDSLPKYFTDPDEGDHLDFSATALDSGLTALIIDQHLALIALPAPNFAGTIRIVISATDDWNVSTLYTLNLTITEVNDAPEFLPGFHAELVSLMNIQEDEGLRVKLLATDVEGDDITFHATSDTSAVTLAITQVDEPELVVLPAPNWFGTARIGISATDGIATTDLDPLILTVGAANDIPDAFDLLNPGNGDQLFLTSDNNEDSLTFEWEPVLDPDDDPVSYTFVLSDSSGVNWEYNGLEFNTVTIACADIAAAIRVLGVNSVTFWWSVYAIAGEDTVPTNQGPFRLTIDAGTLSIEDGGHVPQLFALHQNYPNPFNPVTTIRFEVPRASHVLLVIYDMRGREVIRLVDEFTSPGYNRVVWNSSDTYGRPVPSGVYIARMLTPEYSHVIKMTIVR